MGYYKQGCQTALSVAGVSVNRHGVGSKEGIRLDRIESGVYEFGRWRIRNMGDHWAVWHP